MRYTLLAMTVSVGAAVDWTGALRSVASLVGMALWSRRQKAQAAMDPVQALTHRLRHPVQDALAHPVVTIRRKADRRRARTAEQPA